MADDFMDDYFKLLERYKFLKKVELPDIADNDLEHAVLSWMWTKIEDDGANQYTVICSLPKPCQNVYSCRTVTDEVNNGGLNQLFFNHTVQLIELSIEGYLALGSAKLSDIMAEAVNLYRQNKHILDGYNDGTIESFSASYCEKLFDELVDRFFQECDLIDCVSYIRSNADCFGD